ncbi:MAG: flagellar assembly protein T N-terminal domain-containing protein [Deltaproteobacteria bacterium]
MMRKKLLVILLLLLCVFDQAAYADQRLSDLTLQVEGRAAVVKNDEARAREEAVKNALEKAIMQAAAKILLDKYEDEKFQAVKSIMVGKVDRYINNYRIISESRQRDECAAHVHVVVATALVHDDLLQMGILPDQSEKEGMTVSLALKGMKKYSDFDRMKTFLQSRSKIVKRIYPCRLEWQRADYSLVLNGEVQSLLTELEKTGRYRVESVNRNQKTVEINLQIKEESR